jgi:hypothetical protein
MEEASREAREKNWKMIRHLWRNRSRSDIYGPWLRANLADDETPIAEGLAFVHHEKKWQSRSPAYVVVSDRRLHWRGLAGWERTRSLDPSDVRSVEVSEDGRRLIVERLSADPLRIEFNRADARAAVALRALLMA